MFHNFPFSCDLLTNELYRRTYDFLVAPERLGRLFMMPAKVAPERVAALRAAFDAMVADPGFLAEAQRSALTVAPMSGREVDRAVTELYATPPDVLARARTIAAE